MSTFTYLCVVRCARHADIHITVEAKSFKSALSKLNKDLKDNYKSYSVVDVTSIKRTDVGVAW